MQADGSSSLFVCVPCSFPGRRGVRLRFGRVRENEPCSTCLASESVVCDGMRWDGTAPTDASRPGSRVPSFTLSWFVLEIKCPGVHAGVGRWGTRVWQSEKLSKFLLAGRDRYKKIDRVPGLIPCLPRGMLAALNPWLKWGVNQQPILMSCHKGRTPSRSSSIPAEQIRIVQYPVPV